MSVRRVIGLLLLLPAVFTAGFFLYAGLSGDPGCGSAEPGLCFGLGIWTMLSAPLALLTTPVALFLLFRSRKATP